MSDGFAVSSVPPKLFSNQTRVLFSDGAPADMAALNEEAADLDRPAFRPNQHVVLGDGTRASWDGSAWVNLDPSAEPTSEPESFDPGEHTIDDVQAYVGEHPDELDAILAAERDGKNRSTLIEWLEGQTETDES